MRMNRTVGWLRRNKKRLIVAAALSLLFGFILLNVVAYNHAYAMTHFIEAGVRTSIPERLSFEQKMTVLFCGVTIPRPRAQATPTEQGLAFDEISIRCQNGIQLGAWY